MNGAARRGFALLTILAICLALAALALLYAHNARLEYRSSVAAVAGAQAGQAVEGVRRHIAYALEQAETPGAFPSLDEYEETGTIGEARYWLIGRDANDSAPLKVAYGLIGESSKLNINTATEDMLLQLPGMTSELAAAIIDWRDEDDAVTEGGAESQTYLLLDEPYRAKNGSFETVGELRMVAGMDWDLLLGEDANRNHILDPNEDDGDASPPHDNADGRLDPGLLAYVTVYSAEPNTDGAGGQRINVSGEDRQELRRILEERLGEAAQQALSALQGNRNFGSLLEFYMASGLEASEFALVEDALTVSDEDTLRGRINPAIAPAEVLACLPGVGPEYAQQLVAARQGKSARELRSIAWVAETLDEQAAALAGPHLTPRSYQFTADIAAAGPQGRGIRRVRYVLDTTSGETVVAHREDMPAYGWPLREAPAEAVRQEDAL